MSGTPQRRSTRATKEPERLAPSTPLTPRKRSKGVGSLAPRGSSAFASPVVSSSKRQRVKSSKSKRRQEEEEEEEEEKDDDDDDEDSDVEPASSSNDSDEEELSEFEGSRPGPTLARQQQKKANKKGTAKQVGEARKAKQNKGGAVAVAASAGDLFQSPLLDAIADEKAALGQVVSDWISSYRSSGDTAVSELLNLIIKLTGATLSTPISPATLYDDDLDSMLEALQAQSIAALKRDGTALKRDGSGEDDILMGKSKEHRRVRKSVLQFLAKLISDGQHHLLFSEVNEESGLSPFVEIMLQWLVSMAGSSFRPFRHVATVVALCVQTAVVGIRARISVELQTTHRQLETESKRGGRKGGSGRQAQLRDRVSQLSEQDSVASSAFKALYDTVFIYRYRDVQATIRGECLVPLATWSRGYPAAYLDTEYLRYLGWALNDKDARVRETALVAIGGPLLLGKQPTHGGVGSGVGGTLAAASEDSVGSGLRPFIGRFLPRIVQVAAGDIDVKVQVGALKLVAQLGKHEYLDPTAKIGDIRSIKKSSGQKEQSRPKKKAGRSRGTYSNSLSQQLLEESSSEEEEEKEEEDEEETGDVGAGALDIQTLYGEGGPAEEDERDAGRMVCPRHTTMRYLAPLVAHTQAAVRAAAAEVAAWWIHSDWARAARVAAVGMAGADVEENEDEDEDGEEDENTGDVGADLLGSASGRRRVRRWGEFKAVGAFLAHVARAPHTQAVAASASLVEEVWAGSDVATGDAAADEGLAPARLVAAAMALWGRLPLPLGQLASYLSIDHSRRAQAFALAPSEETALVQAFGVWAQEPSDRGRRVAIKSGAADPGLWYGALPRLLARNGDSAARVAALAGAAAALDAQALFDADRGACLEDVARHMTAALERHCACVRVVRPAAAFLARVDASGVLRDAWAQRAAEAAARDPTRVYALRALLRAADVSSAVRISDLLAAASSSSANECVALAALDAALHALLWRALAARESRDSALAADRDLMLASCGSLVTGDGRLAELAFVALGRVLRVFTGPLVRVNPALAVDAPSADRIRQTLTDFFAQRMAAWTQRADDADPVGYTRTCALAAAWVSWLADQTLRPAALSQLARLTGAAGPDRRSADAPVRRRVGFVALSVIDHIVQAGVDALKPQLVREHTRAAAIEALAASLRASFEAQPFDAVNVATLARFVAQALRTAEAPAATLAPAAVGAAWATAHAQAIAFGLALSEPEPWFAAMSLTVAGVLRPRHALALSQRLAEADTVAVLPYQRSLDKVCAKLGAVEARLAETRPAQPLIRPAPIADNSMDIDE
ncbi:cohesin complex subunit [Coemansia sp. BCRC 34301]|nr:cohesin complex subunit [Coemansia sp. BCRC 34301]